MWSGHYCGVAFFHDVDALSSCHRGLNRQRVLAIVAPGQGRAFGGAATWLQDELGGELGHVWKLLKAGRQSGSRARDFNIKLQTVQWQRRWGRRTSRRQQFRFENVHTGWNDTKTSITCRVSRLVIVDGLGFEVCASFSSVLKSVDGRTRTGLFTVQCF